MGAPAGPHERVRSATADLGARGAGEPGWGVGGVRRARRGPSGRSGPRAFRGDRSDVRRGARGPGSRGSGRGALERQARHALATAHPRGRPAEPDERSGARLDRPVLRRAHRPGALDAGGAGGRASVRRRAARVARGHGGPRGGRNGGRRYVPPGWTGAPIPAPHHRCFGPQAPSRSRARAGSARRAHGRGGAAAGSGHDEPRARAVAAVRPRPSGRSATRGGCVPVVPGWARSLHPRRVAERPRALSPSHGAIAGLRAPQDRLGDIALESGPAVRGARRCRRGPRAPGLARPIRAGGSRQSSGVARG